LLGRSLAGSLVRVNALSLSLSLLSHSFSSFSLSPLFLSSLSLSLVSLSFYFLPLSSLSLSLLTLFCFFCSFLSLSLFSFLSLSLFSLSLSFFSWVMSHNIYGPCNTLYMGHDAHAHRCRARCTCTPMNDSCHTIWISHVTQYKWVLSHTQVPCPAMCGDEWVMPHTSRHTKTRMSHANVHR